MTYETIDNAPCVQAQTSIDAIMASMDQPSTAELAHIERMADEADYDRSVEM